MHSALPRCGIKNECESGDSYQKEERGYPEVCTYTIESDDDYEDYQQGRNLRKKFVVYLR